MIHRATLLIVMGALFIRPVDARADPASDSDTPSENETPPKSKMVRPFEAELGLTLGWTSVGAMRLGGSGVNGARVSASGAELGYTQPWIVGFDSRWLFFPSPRFGFGGYVGTALGWGGSSTSPVAAAVRPTVLTVTSIGSTAQFVVLDGDISVRLGATAGVRLASVNLDAPEFRKSDGREGSAVGAAFFVSPQVTVVHRLGRYWELGEFISLDFVSSDLLAPSFGTGAFVAIR